MRPLHICTLALAALASASKYGYWDVQYTESSAANGFQSHSINSTYHNKNLPKGKSRNVVCHYTYTPGNPPSTSSSCSDKAFSYNYDGENITLAQTVILNNKRTKISGSGPINLEDEGGAGKTFSGNATVLVSKAVAA